MGEPTVEFTNTLKFPLSDPVDAATEGLQRFTATVEALVVPDIDAALDEAPGKDGVLERLQGARSVVARIAAVLGGPRRALAFAGLTAAIAAYTAGADHLWRGGLWPDVLFIALVLIPTTLALVLLLLPLAFGRGWSGSPLLSRGSRLQRGSPTWTSSSTWRSCSRSFCSASGFSPTSRTSPGRPSSR